MNWKHHGTAPRATPTTADRIPDRRPVSHRRTRRSQPTIGMWAHTVGLFRPGLAR